MNVRLVHLKIKIKSLADESRLIKHETKKMHGPAMRSLHEHRVNVVRPATRTNHLAYGLLRGVRYEDMERSCRERPNFKEVSKTALRFGGDPEKVDFWLGEAETYLKWSGTQKAA